MKEFEVTVTRRVFYTTVVKVTAENEFDAEDRVEEMFFQDDGCHGIRDALEFLGHSVECKVKK